MEFYERMRELRKEHGETQAQVAAAAGMTDRQYQRFETGKQKPGFDSLLALADHFGVSLDYLAGRSDRRGLFSGMHPPILFLVLPKKRTCRARCKRKRRFGRNFARACKVAVRGSA